MNQTLPPLLSRPARLLCIVLAAGGGSLLAQEPRPAAPVADRTRVIDPQKIRQALAQATAPIAERVQASAIPARINDVREVLREKTVDTEKLDTALQALRDSMDAFTRNFDETVEPLWAVKETIGDTIGRARLLAERAGSKDPSPAVQGKIEGYDRRLHELASQISKERDEGRRQRLRMLFASMLQVRQLAERFGKINLGPASQAVYTKLVESLTRLQDGLTAFLFRLEHTRLVLQETSGIVGEYQSVVRGLGDIKDLRSVIREMTADLGMAEGNDDLNPLLSPLEGITGEIEGFLMEAVRGLEDDADVLPTPNVDLGTALDKDIERYLKTPTPVPGQ